MVEEAGGALSRVVRALRLQIALLIFDDEDELDADDHDDDELDADDHDDDDKLDGDAGELGDDDDDKKHLPLHVGPTLPHQPVHLNIKNTFKSYNEGVISDPKIFVTGF